MELSTRQAQIVAMLQETSPMTGEEIAARLGVGVPTIRLDLRVLTAVEILSSRPKVGYSYRGEAKATGVTADYNAPIRTILLPTTEIKATATLEKAVTTMFLNDVGSLYVVDDDGELVGLISRKDLLRASFTSRDASDMLASIAMTRMPNLFTVTPDISIREAGLLLLHHNVDSLPVVEKSDSRHPIGKITKNRIFTFFMNAIK